MSKFENDPNNNNPTQENPSSNLQRAETLFESGARITNKERKWWEKMLLLKN